MVGPPKETVQEGRPWIEKMEMAVRNFLTPAHNL